MSILASCTNAAYSAETHPPVFHPEADHSMIAVRKKFISTSSLSATSTLASQQPPVSHLGPHVQSLSYTYTGPFDRSLDLQMRWYRQADYREIREGMRFFPCCKVFSFLIAAPRAIFPLVGEGQNDTDFFRASQVFATQRPQQSLTSTHTKHSSSPSI